MHHNGKSRSHCQFGHFWTLFWCGCRSCIVLNGLARRPERVDIFDRSVLIDRSFVQAWDVLLILIDWRLRRFTCHTWFSPSMWICIVCMGFLCYVYYKVMRIFVPHETTKHCGFVFGFIRCFFSRIQWQELMVKLNWVFKCESIKGVVTID